MFCLALAAPVCDRQTSRCTAAETRAYLRGHPQLVSRRAGHVATHATRHARAAPSDTLDWTQFGAPYTVVAVPVAGTTANGVAFTLNAAGPVERYEQNGGWDGNFAPGTQLILGFPPAGPLQIDFSGSGYNGISFQFQSFGYGAFQFRVELFDSLNTLLVTQDTSGTSDNANDGSAVTATLTSVVNFNRVIITGLTGPVNPQAFAIGPVTLAIGTVGTE